MILTANELRVQLKYCPSTGIFTRLTSTSPRVKVGDIVGSLRKDGYLSCMVSGKRYLMHRLAHFYMTGSWPIRRIDHEDQNRSNNKWDNLREATDEMNSKNQKKRSNNTTGCMGVYPNKVTGKWYAQIGHNGKMIALGTFPTKEQAITARKEAEIEYDYHPNHGQD